jgi:hypothetical protein
MTAKTLNEAIEILKANGLEVVCFPFTKNKVIEKGIEVNKIWIADGVLKASWGSLDLQGEHVISDPKNITR